MFQQKIFSTKFDLFWTRIPFNDCEFFKIALFKDLGKYVGETVVSCDIYFMLGPLPIALMSW